MDKNLEVLKRMDNETKQMFELILAKFDKVDQRFDNIESRFDNLENEFKEFRKETKEELKLIDGKIDMMYLKLNKDIEEIKNKPEARFRIERE